MSGPLDPPGLFQGKYLLKDWGPQHSIVTEVENLGRELLVCILCSMANGSCSSVGFVETYKTKICKPGITLRLEKGVGTQKAVFSLEVRLC